MLYYIYAAIKCIKQTFNLIPMFQKHHPQPVFTEPIQSNHTTDDVETVVGPSVKVEGDFASEGNIVVKGTVTGSVKTSIMLTVENGAKIFANVRAENSVVAGGIKGNVKVSERLELSETAQIYGDIECKVLSVAPGALLYGKIMMKGISLVDESEKKEEKKRFLGKIKTEEEVMPPSVI